MAGNQGTPSATFGGGCFWCTEAVFQQLKGVTKVTSGYAGGAMDRPSYQQVSAGGTGHAEVIQVAFDPAVISYHDLLHVFFTAHDPTTVNRQGADVGSQYRSTILYADEAQRQEAEAVIKELEVEEVYDRPIITELKPLDQFYPAESYHQNYYSRNSDAPDCQVVINPKLSKVRAKFQRLLK